MRRIKALVVLVVFGFAMCFGGVVCWAYSEGPYTYQVKNNEATITGFDKYECTDTEIIIPSKLGGYPVVSIEAGVLSNNYNVVSLVIPEGVTNLGGFNAPVFADCSKLKKVTIPSSLRKSWSAFKGCNIEEVYISDVNSWISIEWWQYSPTSSNIARKMYCNNQLIEKLVIKEGATVITSYAFNYCTHIDTVTLPKSVTAIGYGAFNGCSGIKDVWYTGTAAEKDNIKISSENAALLNATWHYNSCPVGAPHEYSNDCDAECNGCGLNRDVPDHKYDNACDTDCNVCKAIRQTQHTYDNSCDTECNICKVKRNITHSYGQWSTVKKADCSTSGTQNRECSVCHHIDSKNVDPLNHDYETKWTVDEAADCTGSGTKSHHCTRCDAKKDITTIPAEGHTWGNWATVKKPTTTAEGKSERKCKACNETETQSIAKLAEDGHTHIFGDWKISKAATCIETGKAERACSICQEKETKEIVATGHQVGEWEETEPTCTEEGYRERKCLVCKEAEKEIEKALGHDLDKDGKCLRCGMSSSEDMTEEKEDQTINENQSNNSKDQNQEKKPSYWWILWVALAVVTGAGVPVAAILIFKKKK